MPAKKYRVRLSEEERQELKGLVSKGRAELCPCPARAEATNWCGRVRVRMLMARRVVWTKAG